MTAKFAVHPAGESKSPIGNIRNEFVVEDLLEQSPRDRRSTRSGGRRSDKKTTLSEEIDKFDEPNDVDRIVDEINSDCDLGDAEFDGIV